MTQKTSQNPWNLDVRVRERNLKSGALTDKDIEKHLAALPDVADQAEPFATPQPALAQPEMPVDLGADDEEDDEDDLDDEGEGAVGAAEESGNDIQGGGGGGVIS